MCVNSSRITDAFGSAQPATTEFYQGTGADRRTSVLNVQAGAVGTPPRHCSAGAPAQDPARRSARRFRLGLPRFRWALPKGYRKWTETYAARCTKAWSPIQSDIGKQFLLQSISVWHDQSLRRASGVCGVKPDSGILPVCTNQRCKICMSI